MTYREPVLDHLFKDLDLGGRHWVFVLEHGSVLLRQRVEVRLVPDQEDRYNETKLSSTVTVLSSRYLGILHASVNIITARGKVMLSQVSVCGLGVCSIRF